MRDLILQKFNISLSVTSVGSLLAELMLSHELVNQTAAAYICTTNFEERRGIMQQWADYLDSVERGADVIPINRAA